MSKIQALIQVVIAAFSILYPQFSLALSSESKIYCGEVFVQGKLAKQNAEDVLEYAPRTTVSKIFYFERPLPKGSKLTYNLHVQLRAKWLRHSGKDWLQVLEETTKDPDFANGKASSFYLLTSRHASCRL